MKELQKYYTGSHLDAMYLASEADAAFAAEIAELRREQSDLVEWIKQQHLQVVEMLKREHAEEIERLKAEHQEGLAGFHRRLYSLQEETDSLNHDFKNFHRLLCDRFGYVHDERDWRRDQVSLIEHIASLRKQAERYEKLRKITPTEFERIFWDSDDTDSSFDALVDQLPASGQAPS